MTVWVWVDRWLSGGTRRSRFNVPVRMRLEDVPAGSTYIIIGKGCS